MKKPLMFALMVPIGVLILSAAAQSQAPRSQSERVSPTREIPQPPTWAPFEADFSVTVPGEPTVRGVFSRASDGSTRRESWPETEPTKRVISIKDFTQGVQYLRFQDGERGIYGWKSFELKEARTPRRYRVNQNLLPHDVIIEGLPTYRQTGVRGDVRVLAPDLNFFPVITQLIATGRREVYTNIRRVEPSRDLFSPPPGASIEPLSREDSQSIPEAVRLLRNGERSPDLR